MRLPFLLSLMVVLSSSAFAAEAIEGKWTTESGEKAVVKSCDDAFCITLQTGKYQGQQIGRLTKEGSRYTGTITDPADNKTYSGTASVKGPLLSLKGCMFKVLCKAQTWTR